MKTILGIIAWIGLFLVILGLTFSLSTSWHHFAGPGSDEEISYFFAACAGYIAATLALVGAFISKPRFIGIGTVIVGTVFVFSFYGYFTYISSVSLASDLLVMVLPGLALIGSGIALKKASMKLEEVEKPFRPEFWLIKILHIRAF